MKLVTAQQMRELEQRADASGNSYSAMMERAGTLTAKAIIERWPLHDRRVLVLVGPGNNGGDGLVCARVLAEAGATVGLYLWKRAAGDEDVNFRLCRERGIEFARAEEDPSFGQLRSGIASAHFVVDALLGTGVTRPIEGILKNILEVLRDLTQVTHVSDELIAPAKPTPQPAFQINDRDVKVIAVDLPTGLNPDTGALDPATLAADLTVTFAFPKVGQYIFPGAQAVGELVVADIGIRREWADTLPLDLATAEEIRELLPARPSDSNKGTFGKALLACGSVEFTGAPILAATAAARVGAGLVTLAVPRSIYPIVAGKLNEATYLPVPDAMGAWYAPALSVISSRLTEYDALLVGCGFGRAETTQAFVEKFLGLGKGRVSAPPGTALVIDADALNALAARRGWWKSAKVFKRAKTSTPILTPHPGEMARLSHLTVAEVQADRIAVARAHAGEWNSIVVLKGAFTVVATPDDTVTVIPFANPALATAGTGDVLAGAIVGFLAQYRAVSTKRAKSTPLEDANQAAIVGAYIHALAGEYAAQTIGDAGMLAGDLLTRLPEAIKGVKNQT